MKKKLLFFFGLLSLLCLSATAQAQKTVSGRVTDTEGAALPGVSVVVEGTTTGTVSNIDGDYKLTLSDGATNLLFSFIGYKTQKVTIGSQTTINVQLAQDTEVLEEVVVTAQGIQRDKRALGYATSSLSASSIEKRPEADIGNILKGKVPGVNITSTNGVAGSGTNVIIRGYSSISGSNQPLFIVDGIPFNTNTNTQGNFTGGGLNGSSRFLDIDPNNIANVQVLKGLSATVLYGQQGRNGVILITTKGGKSGSVKDNLKVTLNQSIFNTEIASIPDYQDTYGNGFHQFPAFFFSNWGDNVNNVETVNHPYSNFSDPSLIAAFPEFQGVQYEYKAYDNVENFFRTGTIVNTSVNLAGSSAKSSYNATITYNDEEGFVPGNELEKINVGLGFKSQFSEKLDVNSTFNFVSTKTKWPPLGASTGSSAVGNGAALFANVMYTPRTVDLNGLPYVHPVDGRSVYYRGGNDIPNPNWLVDYTSQESDVKRFFASTAINYDLTDDLSISYRGGIDTYNEFQQYKLNRGIGPGPANGALDLGLYRTTNITNIIYDNSLILNYNKQINDDLNIGALLGFNSRIDQFEQDGLESSGQVAFGFFEHSNFTTQSPKNSFTANNDDIQRIEEQRLNGVYAQVNLDYKNYLYVSLQGRNDWSSTVENNNNSLFYPSVSVSFIPTTAFDIESEKFNYAKVRVSYGTSAGYPDPYSTRNTLASVANAFTASDGTVLTTNATSRRLGNPNLKPELQQEFEIGLEAKGFNNRIGIDFSYYNRTTKDLLTDVGLDPSTGYTQSFINVGQLKNTGYEIVLNATPLEISGFRWDLNVNFNQYESVVEELADELGENAVVVNAGFVGFAENALIEGEPFNVIRTTVTERDENGNRIVDGNGFYKQAADVEITGDPNPDFTLTGTSNFSYKGFRLSMQWDYRHGGDIFSITSAAIPGRGLTGNFDRESSVILPGVKEDGNVNDIAITTTDAFFNNFGFGPGEFRVFDGTTIRLREISLSYTVPNKFLEKLPVSNLSVSLIGQNLWFKSVNMPEEINFDTDVLGTGVGNGLGMDFLTGPSAKKYGLTLSATF